MRLPGDGVRGLSLHFTRGYYIFRRVGLSQSLDPGVIELHSRLGDPNPSLPKVVYPIWWICVCAAASPVARYMTFYHITLMNECADV